MEARKTDIKYTLKEVFIVPSPLSSINSRSECNPLMDSGMLPLFTAPMSSVVGLNNYKTFQEHRINSILPRTVSLGDRVSLCNSVWCAFSISEFEMIVYERISVCDGIKKVLIDIANGNMLKLMSLIEFAKDKYGDEMLIMAGNIANPETYIHLSNSGADFVRLGVGSGSACITASNTGIHYPMGSLIRETYEASIKSSRPAYIVADGGMRGYSDIIKSLALGADYVMCGSIFNKMEESAGRTIINPIDGLKYKKHYGMSTKKAQIEMGRGELRTSEGVEFDNKIEYTMSQWVDNFKDYLTSSMSYTNSKTIYDFIGEVDFIIGSPLSYESINL